MNVQKKIMAMLFAIFSVSGALNFFFVSQAGKGGGLNLPYPLFTVLLAALALLCTYLLISNILQHQEKEGIALQRALEWANRELETTKVSQEERIERRTFEISVANAALNREIAERIQAESEMKRIKHQMELILQSAGEGIFGLDANGNVTFVNRAASVMLGWETHELIGRAHHEMVHHTKSNGEVYPPSQCPISQAFQDGRVHFGSDEVFWAKDNSSFPVEYVSTPILENGKLTGAVVVFRDRSTFS
jgi:PAS domain S-box-containing protein